MHPLSALCLYASSTVVPHPAQLCMIHEVLRDPCGPAWCSGDVTRQFHGSHEARQGGGRIKEARRVRHRFHSPHVQLVSPRGHLCWQCNCARRRNGACAS